MLDLQGAAHRSHDTRLLGWLAAGLILLGVAALGWSSMQQLEARNYQMAARRALEAAAPRAPTASAFEPKLGSRADRRPEVVRGAPLAALSIPRLGLAAVVLHGSDARTLQRGLGHIESTAMPGDAGNVGIAGHRDSFFRPLRHVQTGDEILLEVPGEQLRYRVTSFRVVEATDVDVLDPTTEPTLTLVTCYPFGYFGSAPDRFVVWATRMPDAGAAHRDSGTGPYAPGGADRDGDAVVGPFTPVLEPEPQPSEPRAADTPRSTAIVDDRSAILEAVERFRIVYSYSAGHARGTARGGDREPGDAVDAPVPLVLQPCRVTIDGTSATATCTSAAGTTERARDAEGAWEFGLVHTGRGWALTSVMHR